MTDQPAEHELHLLTGAYAADALSPEERARFEAHLDGCGPCRDEVRELTATAARLADAARVEPPADLRARVLTEVRRTRQLSPLGGGGDADGGGDSEVVPLRRGRVGAAPWWRQPGTAAAAALLVVAAGLGGVAVQQHRRADDARSMADQVASVVADPGHTVRTAAVRGGGTGLVMASGRTAVFHADGLPALPDGRAYQLWRIRGDRPQSAGVLGGGGAATAVVTGVAPGDAIGVTVEPAGGSDQPTTDPVFLVSTG